MKCEICGEEIAANSKYCRKCGSKLEYSQKKMDECAIEWLIDGKPDLKAVLKNNQFKKIEIKYSSLENMNFDEELKIEGDSLKLNLKKDDAFKLICAYIINELDSIHTEYVEIYKELHNDRIARIVSGKQMYERALKTKDKKDKKRELINASCEVIKGLNELKNEMIDSLNLFQKIPKSRIKKLFCGISLKDATQKLDNIQEAFPYYLSGVALLIKIDMERGETENILGTLYEAQEYVHSFYQHKGYGRLLEIDDENKDKWENSIESFKIALKLLTEKLENDVICIDLGGDYYE